MAYGGCLVGVWGCLGASGGVWGVLDVPSSGGKLARASSLQSVDFREIDWQRR